MVALETAIPPTIAEDRTRDFGQLVVTRGEKRARLPLAGVTIQARVADRIAQVSVEQKFHNPFTEALEATYIFPLSGGAAVSAFEMKVGTRVIKGVVKERGEARRVYRQAIEEGKRAALLEQDRDDVFTVQVGNLPPGEEVSVRIVTSERLPFFEDGTTELRLPLVVAPRYIPGAELDRDPVGDGVAWDTDQVSDASRITPPRLAKGFDPKVALQIGVELADGALSDFACSQHAIKLSNGTVKLVKQDELLNRDFVLRWRISGEKVRTTLLTTKDGYGLLSILPPKREGFLGLARDVVFILDRSGSMSGTKMTSAARACSMLLTTLGPRDRFALVAFDDSTEWFSGKTFVRADEASVAAGEKFLRGIEVRGGTELDPAMHETLDLIGARKEEEGRVPVVVVLTDGQIGNESAVLKRLQKDGGDTRIFTVGIDSAVNAAFLTRLAKLGGGTCTCVVPGEALEEALLGIGREIGAPLVVDVKVEGAEDLAPARVPDLFAGRAATVFFKIPKGKSVTVRGTFADGKAFQEIVKPRELELAAIGHLWARTRVADLEDRFRLGASDAVKKEIIALAISHTLLTRFTSFVVVDESEIVNQGGRNQRVTQPVEMPDQWEHEENAKCAEMSALSISASTSVPQPCMAPPPPAPKSAPGGVMKKMKSIFRGKKDDCEAPEPQEKPIGAGERKSVDAAIEALRKALEAAKAELAAGRIPKAAAIEKARKALLRELAGSRLGVELAVLQQLLRSGLLELVAALGTPGVEAATLLPILERCLQPLEAGARFWEATI